MNVVRWSPDGNLLASGSDDKCVLVYFLNPNESSKVFGTHAAPNKENWSTCYTLRGHTMEVLDIAFSPREILASASLDNKIMLWDMATPSTLMGPFKILQEHTSFVKGISFDPIGILCIL